MENSTNDYTHLSTEAIDDIMRNMGIQLQNLNPGNTIVVDTAAAGDYSTYTATSSASVETPPSWQQEDFGLSELDEDDDEEPQNPAQNNVRDGSLSLVRTRTFYDNEQHSSFYGADWFQNAIKQDVFVAGAGGISSWTAMLIARLGVEKLTIIDDDNIEARNLSGQLFKLNQVSMRKVFAVANNIAEFTHNVGVHSIVGRIDASFNFTTLPKIVISGFDNMTARKTLYKKWKEALERIPAEQRQEYLFIDGRLAFDFLQVYSFTGDQEYFQTRYEKEFLFDDSEAEETVCSVKQTSYMANLIAGFISSIVIAFCAKNYFVIPFVLEFDSRLFNFRIER